MNKNKIIIIYADLNLNIIDGSTIWLSNIINTLNNENKTVYFLNLYKIKNNNFMRNITNNKLFKIIDCNSIADVKNKLELFYNENKNNIEEIIIRSKLIFDVIDENWHMLNYTTFYGLDIHLSNIVGLNNKFKELFVRSEKLKELFVSNGVDENKIKLTPPIAWKYDFNLPERTDEEIRLIYVGTLRDEENILEIIEEFKKIHESRPEVVLKIIYGKIRGDDEFVNKINQIINEGVKGITFLYNLSHKDTCYEIATSDIGICWRKNGWWGNGELSTKEKEYEMYGLIIFNNSNINNLSKIINSEYLKIIKNLNISNDLKIKLIDYNLKSDNLINNKIIKKFKINFIIYTYTCYNLINEKRKGNTENEINIMCNLTQICDVYYNDIYINDLIDKHNYLCIDKVNERLKQHKINGFKYYDGYEIFIPSQNYDFIFYRGDYRNQSKILFNLLPDKKIYCNVYDEQIWSKEIIGFQTYINSFLAKKNILNEFEEDGTLLFQKNMTIPKNVFIRYQFIKEANNIVLNVDYKKMYDTSFLIGIIGNINKFTSIYNYLNDLNNFIEQYNNKKIKILILANEIYETYNNKNIIVVNNLPHDKYLECLSQLDVVINTWNISTCIYSGSNKNLDCISLNIPLICPYSLSYAQVLGADYWLYYKINDSKTLINNLKKILFNENNIIEKIKNKFEYIKKNYNNENLILYYDQMCKYEKKNMLVDYHNHFYFVDELVEKFSKEFNVNICKWESNDNEKRLELLKKSNIIFCEWGVENAVWYSNNKKKEQKLFIRVHRWEIFTKAFFKINWNNVDKVIFITPEMERIAKIRLLTYNSLNIDNFDKEYYVKNNTEFFSETVTINNAWEHFNNFINKTSKVPNFRLLNDNINQYSLNINSIMIYNYAKTSMFENNSKTEQYQFNIGMLGFVPMIKRLDIAIEIINIMVKKDKRYKLYILGKSIYDLPWLQKNSYEVEYYKKVEQKIIDYNLSEHIIFEKYTEYPNIWMGKIGYLLSVSDIEGSHQAVAESMASGVIPFIYGLALKKYKLDEIYPKEFCFYDTLDLLCDKIFYYSQNEKEFMILSQFAKKYAYDNFNIEKITNKYMCLLNDNPNLKYTY